MAWRSLSRDAWLDHPLNRVRGWIAAIVVLRVLQLLHAVTVLSIGLRLAVEGGAGWRNAHNQPEFWTELGWGFIDIAPVLALLWAIWARWRFAPELNLALTVTWLGFAGLTVFSGASNPLVPPPSLGYEMAIPAFIWLAIALYFFIGARPNVMFCRRVRAAP